jgi:hypothetical protein
MQNQKEKTLLKMLLLNLKLVGPFVFNMVFVERAEHKEL